MTLASISPVLAFMYTVSVSCCQNTNIIIAGVKPQISNTLPERNVNANTPGPFSTIPPLNTKPSGNEFHRPLRLITIASSVKNSRHSTHGSNLPLSSKPLLCGLHSMPKETDLSPKEMACERQLLLKG